MVPSDCYHIHYDEHKQLGVIQAHITNACQALRQTMYFEHEHKQHNLDLRINRNSKHNESTMQARHEVKPIHA